MKRTQTPPSNDEDTSAVRFKSDVAALRVAISEDAAGSRTSAPESGHVILNWLQVGLIIGTIIISVISSTAVAWYRLDAIDGLLHEVKGAQEKNSTKVLELRLKMETLEGRAREDRQAIEKMKTQMSYRLRFEASVMALNPDHPWP